MMKPLTLEYYTSSALTQMSVYHCGKFSSWLVIACTSFLLSFAILLYPPKAVRQTLCVPHEPY